ncbi:hypothetical protein FNV43_RR02334 [Rhamnella rubrinervis]|uniref:RNase H type-1 domain-containing protein n=1 Tax=Rhamnella rubrinervis TaxID=2594499 RepID=A0A8K0HS42_9ROSA|nr:hypothetical protein FNV43_RR02334 [Rhamnella rubrinervis]
MEEFSMLKESDKQHCFTASSPSSSIRWVSPSIKWIKVNVDAAHIENGSAAAMVVRNENGKLLLLFSTLTNCRSPFERKLEALNWATTFAEAGN